jgi:hypothetical protein
VSRSQRLAFLAAAVVIAVVAVIVLSSGGKDDGGQTMTSGDVVLEAGSVKKIAAKEGETVSFSVRSDDKKQEVHVHGYNLMQDAAPGKPAHFSFKATITGRFDIEFEETSTQIGELTVNPA